MASCRRVFAGLWKRVRKLPGHILFFIVLVIVAAIRFDVFLSMPNILNIARQVSMIGLVSIGMSFVILIGGIDLSVGAVLALSGVLAAMLSERLLLAIALPILLGAAVGLLNGVLAAKVRIASFIATLSTMMASRGLAFLLTDEMSIGVNQLSQRFTTIGRGFVLGIPIPALIFLLIVALAVFIARYTAFGRHLYAAGGNEEAARMMGLNIAGIKISAFVISGVLSAIAGIILSSRLGAGQPVAGSGWEMNAVAASVIGGFLLTGGVGRFGGTLVGILIIGVITNVINLQGNMNTWWRSIIMGSIMLIAVFIQTQKERRLQKY